MGAAKAYNPTTGQWEYIGRVGPVGPAGPTGPAGPAGADGVDVNTHWTRWYGTQAAYDAITTKDVNTLYVITD